MAGNVEVRILLIYRLLIIVMYYKIVHEVGLHDRYSLQSNDKNGKREH